MITNGDCIEVMAGMEPESVDAIVTDPPYGLEFMGKEWDSFGVRQMSKDASSGPRDPDNPWQKEATGYGYGKRASAFQEWSQRWGEQAFRIAKPSAYLLAFGGTRTVHRMTVALEDAGWIIRDMLVWGYASGFPKSKATLKPAWEPIVMARKPGPLRNLAIDECRIPISRQDAEAIANAGGFLAAGWKNEGSIYEGTIYGKDSTQDAEAHPAGRWPANIALTDPIFDGGVEGVVGGGETALARYWGPTRGDYDATSYQIPTDPDFGPHAFYGDTGTYSRFFLIPKAMRSDREPVLGALSGLEEGVIGGEGHALRGERAGVSRDNKARQNVHPTVKPTELMRHLVRLVTPVGGTVLDPFLGSGTTAVAAELEGFAWLGIEREKEYVAIAEARLNGTQRGLGLDIPAPVTPRKATPDTYDGSGHRGGPGTFWTDSDLFFGDEEA